MPPPIKPTREDLTRFRKILIKALVKKDTPYENFMREKKKKELTDIYNRFKKTKYADMF